MNTGLVPSPTDCRASLAMTERNSFLGGGRMPEAILGEERERLPRFATQKLESEFLLSRIPGSGMPILAMTESG